MKIDVIKLLEILKTNPEYSLLLIPTIAFYLYINKKIPFFLKKKNDKIENHVFFLDMKKWINYVIPNLKFEDKRRQGLWKKFLLIKFNIIYDDMLSFVKKKRENDCNIGALLIKAIDDSTLKISKELIINGIPKVFVDKFNESHSKRISFLDNALQDVQNARSFNTCEDKLKAMLYCVYSTYGSTMHDCDIILDELNGELDAEFDIMEQNNVRFWE